MQNSLPFSSHQQLNGDDNMGYGSPSLPTFRSAADYSSKDASSFEVWAPETFDWRPMSLIEEESGERCRRTVPTAYDTFPCPSSVTDANDVELEALQQLSKEIIDQWHETYTNFHEIKLKRLVQPSIIRPERCGLKEKKGSISATVKDVDSTKSSPDPVINALLKAAWKAPPPDKPIISPFRDYVNNPENIFWNNRKG